MKRIVVCMIALAAAGCASHSPEQIEAWCSRYAAKHMSYGTHADLNAYREDLMSTCMAMKGVPYAAKPAAGARAKAD